MNVVHGHARAKGPKPEYRWYTRIRHEAKRDGKPYPFDTYNQFLAAVGRMAQKGMSLICQEGVWSWTWSQ